MAQADRPSAWVLDDSTVLAISGDDARSWLNGQVTNDVRSLAPFTSTFAFVLSVKGRVMSDAWILACEDANQLYVLVADDAADEVAAHFDKYIIMEDVEVSRRDDLRGLTVQGPGSAEALANLPEAATRFETCRLGVGGFDVLVPRDVLDELRAQVAVTWLSAEELALAHLQTGRPRFGVDFWSDHHPQDTGLLGAAVSFDKGCYLGQEVVVMIQHRGQAPRTMVKLSGPGTKTWEPGTSVNRDGVPVGEIRSSMVDPSADVVLAFAHIKRGKLDSEAAYQVCGAAVCVEPVTTGTR